MKTDNIYDHIQSNPGHTISWIKSSASPSGSLETQNNFLSAIISDLPKGSPLALPYQEEAKRLKVLRDEKQKSQQLDKPVADWNDILALDVKANTELSKEDYLIYSLYTVLPPVRADYCNMLFSATPLDENTNYISTAQPKWYFVFNQYKTSKTYGQITTPIPEPIKTLLEPYLPQGICKMSENALTKRVISIFKRLGMPGMSITLLRHSYIKEFLKTKRTIKERELVSRQMHHSTTLQERYDLISSE
jgi:hypothetical protein